MYVVSFMSGLIVEFAVLIRCSEKGGDNKTAQAIQDGMKTV